MTRSEAMVDETRAPGPTAAEARSGSTGADSGPVRLPVVESSGSSCGCSTDPDGGVPDHADLSAVPEGSGCHGGAERLLAAADASGKAQVLKELAEDYPTGPHDAPQGMCPAFGSLRVGLRMRRTATVLSGSACCVYGLTFTSHFYGARRTVGYVPFDSESLVTGQLFEDIKKAMEELADPERYDTIVMTNLCIPTASGVPLDLLPDEINGVRIIGIDVPGFGVPTHAEAKDVLAGALLRYARKEAAAGPVARPDDLVEDKPTVTLLGELFPADPMGINAMLAPMGVAVGSTVPPREWRELYKALDCDVVGAVHPFYTRSVRELEAAGRPVVGSAPVGMDGSAAWLKAIGEATGTGRSYIDAAVDAAVGACKGAYQKMPVDGRIVVSGYEGSELLVARVLIESGAEVPYVGTALPKTPWSAQDREWLAQHGCHVQYRARLEDDRAAYRDVNPDLVLGTTPTVQSAKEDGIPALYFTNLISARPIFGPAGAGGLSAVIGGAMRGKERLGKMRAFFQGVGEGHTAGYGWTEVPERHLSAKERNAKARGGAAVTGEDAGEAGAESPKASAESPKAAAGSPESSGESPKAAGESPKATEKSPKASAESPNAAAESQPQPAEASA